MSVRRRGEGAPEPTPLGDRLRALALPYTADGNLERGRGLVQAADLVDEEAHLLSGRAFVDALDRMIARRLEGYTADFVADVVAALRDQASQPGSAAPPPRKRAAALPRAAEPTPPVRPPSVRLAPAARLRPAIASSTAGAMGRGERKVLTAIVQHTDSAAGGGVSFAQLQALTGFKARTRQDYVSRLQSRGYIARGGRGLVSTDAGAAALGSYEKLPTGNALLAHWLRELGEGESRVLDLVARYWPHPVGGERIEAQTGYASRTRQDYVSRLISRHLIEKAGSGGHVKACDHLFDGERSARAAAGHGE